MANPPVRAQHQASQRVGDVGEVITGPDGQVGPLADLEAAHVVKPQAAGPIHCGQIHDLGRHKGVGAHHPESGCLEGLAKLTEQSARLVGSHPVHAETHRATGGPEIGHRAHARGDTGVG